MEPSTLTIENAVDERLSNTSFLVVDARELSRDGSRLETVWSSYGKGLTRM